MTGRERYPEVYDSPRWRALRRLVLQEARFLCERCRAAGRIAEATIVHHVKPIESGGPRWARSNLQALCRPCHTAVHAELDASEGKETIPGRAAWDAYIDALQERAS